MTDSEKQTSTSLLDTQPQAPHRRTRDARHQVGHANTLHESIRRLQAYVEAGADVLSAPGPQTAEDIKALVDAVRPKPFNLLVVRDSGLGVSDIAELGVRRISVGGAFALAAWGGFMRAAEILKSRGSFAGLIGIAPYADINGFLHAEFQTREAREP